MKTKPITYLDSINADLLADVTSGKPGAREALEKHLREGRREAAKQLQGLWFDPDFLKVPSHSDEQTPIEAGRQPSTRRAGKAVDKNTAFRASPRRIAPSNPGGHVALERSATKSIRFIDSINADLLADVTSGKPGAREALEKYLREGRREAARKLQGLWFDPDFLKVPSHSEK